MLIRVVEYRDIQIQIKIDEKAKNPILNSDFDFIPTNSYFADKIYSDSQIKKYLSKDSVYLTIYEYINEKGKLILTTQAIEYKQDNIFGYIIVNKRKMVKRYGRERVSKKLKDTIKREMLDILGRWNQYIVGNTFKYEYELNSEILSKGNLFYIEEAIEEAKRSIKSKLVRGKQSNRKAKVKIDRAKANRVKTLTTNYTIKNY